MPERTSHDGKPFFCTGCGSEWSAYRACCPDRRLEPEAEAVKRKADFELVFGKEVPPQPPPRPNGGKRKIGFYYF